eukprot:4380471-Pyramimonas_sp.AAC.1
MPDGPILGPTVVCISTVKRVIRSLCVRWQSKQAADHLSLPASPAQQRAHVRSRFIGGQWPMHRQWASGCD